MTETDYLTQIQAQFNHRVRIASKRPGLFQLVAPFYHEDGDMYDIFLEDHGSDAPVRITDKGLTLMRLSYSFELDTPAKERIYRQILSEHEVQDDNGELFIHASFDRTYEAIMQFTRAVTAICNMSRYRRDVVRSLFYEMLGDFVNTELEQFSPESNYLPIPDRDDLEVDYMIPTPHKPIYLFGARDGSKARLVSISCLEFLRSEIPFRSVVVHENFEALTTKDRRILTNVVDKQFTDLDDFQKSGADYIRREIA